MNDDTFIELPILFNDFPAFPDDEYLDDEYIDNIDEEDLIKRIQNAAGGDNPFLSRGEPVIENCLINKHLIITVQPLKDEDIDRSILYFMGDFELVVDLPYKTLRVLFSKKDDE